MSRCQPQPQEVVIKVLVKSPFSQYSGYGTDGFGLLRALHQWGCDVYPQPTWVDVPIPKDLLPLFGKSLHGPFDLTINHWDPADLSLRPEAREMTRCAVAWTMWEFAPAPGPVEMKKKDGTVYTASPKSGLIPHCGRRSSLPKRLQMFDLVLGYDQVSLDSLAPYIPKSVASGILQGGYESGNWPRLKRDWSDDADFMFGMHGALNNRKCPWTVVQAFNELKIEKGDAFAGAKLGLHTTVPGVFPELENVFKDKRLKVFMETWDDETLKDFYQACHVLVYPSRGEGKNLPALEFQTTGAPVIATNFGGHTNWLSGDYAYPLDYTLMPTFPQRPDAAHDARVSVAAVKEAMWHVFTHRAEAREKGEIAARVIPSMCDWSYVVNDLWRRIRDLVEFNGELIYNMAQDCRREARQADDSRAGGFRPGR